MAMDWMDSTDHYDLVGDITAKWTTNVSNSTAHNTSAPTGRGPNCLDVLSGVGVTRHYSTGWVIGAAMYFATDLGFGSQTVYTISAANEVTLGLLKVESDGTLSLYGGNTANLIGNTGTVPFKLFSQRWYYVEVKSELSGSTPISIAMTLRVNGISLISGTVSTGRNVADTLLGTNEANYHNFSNGTIDSYTCMRDFYIADTTNGGSVTDFAGDVAISALFPRADVTMNWTAVGGSTATGWDHTNPQFPEINDDTVYIEDNNIGDVFDADWQPVTTFSGVIVAVHYGVYARKDDEGTRTFRQRTQGTANSPTWSPGDSYVYYFFAMDADPSTGVAWTQAGFNGSTFGVEIDS